MASRRDLIDSFQFAARRVVSAVVGQQTDPTEWPYRRLSGASFGAVMVTVIALAATGIFGLISPGGKTSWRDGKSVIVVKETGAAYVYEKGELHPVLNFASAALLVGSPTRTSTSRASLVGVTRGVELGIPDAPATLPQVSDLVTPPWSFCTQQTVDTAGNQVSRTWMVVGRRPRQGTAPGEAALLVSDTADGQLYLIWHQLRFRLAAPDADRVALGLDNQVAVPVGDAWLQALPAGPAIAPIKVTGHGGGSRAVHGGIIGDVLEVRGADQTEDYLVRASELQPISALQALIQQAAGAHLHQISAGTAAAAPKQALAQTGATQPPAAVPEFVRPAQSSTVVCAAYLEGSFSPQVLVNSEVPVDSGLETGSRAANGTPLADRVWVPPGRAALVEAVTSPQATEGPLYLVTDMGRRYAISSTGALASLGLGDATISRLPAGLLVRLPEGSALDPSDARLAVPEDTTGNPVT